MFLLVIEKPPPKEASISVIKFDKTNKHKNVRINSRCIMINGDYDTTALFLVVIKATSLTQTLTDGGL